MKNVRIASESRTRGAPIRRVPDLPPNVHLVPSATTTSSASTRAEVLYAHALIDHSQCCLSGQALAPFHSLLDLPRAPPPLRYNVHAHTPSRALRGPVLVSAANAPSSTLNRLEDGTIRSLTRLHSLLQVQTRSRGRTSRPRPSRRYGRRACVHLRAIRKKASISCSWRTAG